MKKAIALQLLVLVTLGSSLAGASQAVRAPATAGSEFALRARASGSQLISQWASSEVFFNIQTMQCQREHSAGKGLRTYYDEVSHISIANCFPFLIATAVKKALGSCSIGDDESRVSAGLFGHGSNKIGLTSDCLCLTSNSVRGERLVDSSATRIEGADYRQCLNFFTPEGRAVVNQILESGSWQKPEAVFRDSGSKAVLNIN